MRTILKSKPACALQAGADRAVSIEESRIMRVLIDIGHPGHIHLFRNFARIFLLKRHEVLFTIREKEFESELIEAEGLPYRSLGPHYSSAPGKIWGLFRYNVKVLFISLRFRPDVYLSHGSLYTLLSALILRKPNITLEDTGNPEQLGIYLPFTKAVLTSESFPFDYGNKQVRYNGYHELAYLHPSYFKPDAGIFKELGLSDGTVFSIVRFVAWSASHDKKSSGLTTEQKIRIVRHLVKRGPLFISSESELPAELEKYRFPLRPEKIHHALAFASLFVGEGATMASECGILGTAAIYINSVIPDLIAEQGREYGLISAFTGFEGVIAKVDEVLDRPDLKSETKSRSERLINSKCDVTAFLVRFVDEWPDSFTKTGKNV
jgi:predicted glycosyltransferase